MSVHVDMSTCRHVDHVDMSVMSIGTSIMVVGDHELLNQMFVDNMQ